jgi:hypothetical protein
MQAVQLGPLHGSKHPSHHCCGFSKFTTGNGMHSHTPGTCCAHTSTHAHLTSCYIKQLQLPIECGNTGMQRIHILPHIQLQHTYCNQSKGQVACNNMGTRLQVQPTAGRTPT